MTEIDLGPRLVDASQIPPRRRRRRWLLAGGAVLLCLGGLAIGLWWRWLYSADALSGRGGYKITARRDVGATFYSPSMVSPDGEKRVRLDIRSVTARVADNSADATIKVLVCHRNYSISRLGSDDLSFCSRTKPFVPGTLTIGTDDPGSDSIVLAITTTHVGRISIHGVHVTYRQGMRHGSQDTGPYVTVRAVRPTPPPPPVTQPPTITAVNPSGGTTAGRTRVVIRGTNFTDYTTVRFGSIEVTGKEVSIVSRRRLVLLTPAHVAGRVDVQVVTALGRSPIVAADRFTYR